MYLSRPCFLSDYRGKSPGMASVVRFGGDASALWTEKHVAGSDAFDGYVSSMQTRASLKAQFFKDALAGLKIKSKTPLVLDIGTGSGSLLKELQQQMPGFRFLGVDLSLPMLVEAKEANVFNTVVANAGSLPFADGSLDAIMLSSVFHELYSYSDPAFSRDGLTREMLNIARHLKPGGHIILRDPAKPPNPDEPLLVRAQGDNGINPANAKALLSALPSRLSTQALLRRFLLEFKPAQGQFEQIDDETFKLPAWVASEFLQHRPFSRTIEDWNSEIREQYGILTVDEMKSLAKTCGFTVPMIKVASEKDHRSRAFRDELRITDVQGEAVDMEERFTITLHAVLKKKRTVPDRS